MLPEIGASELLVIAIVALIVVGPKDLPVMLRKFGQFMAKLRGMASEFRASFDEMARQSELDELRKEVEAMRRGVTADLPPLTLNQAGRDIEDSLADVGVNFGPPLGAQHEAFQASQAAEALPAPDKKPRARKATASKTAAKPAARKPRAKKAVEGKA